MSGSSVRRPEADGFRPAICRTFAVYGEAKECGNGSRKATGSSSTNGISGLAFMPEMALQGFDVTPPERPGMRLSPSFVLLTTALLSACVPAERELATAKPTALASPVQNQDASALSFVQERCGDCHALRPGAEPPNLQAPSFVAVANDMGFNQDSLREFLRDGHDAPDAMSIMLTREEAEMASAYIMSLRSAR